MSYERINRQLLALGLQHEAGQLETSAYLEAQKRLLQEAMTEAGSTATAQTRRPVAEWPWLLYALIAVLLLTVVAVLSFFMS